jgi:hypothetical protein
MILLNKIHWQVISPGLSLRKQDWDQLVHWNKL